MEGYCSWCCEKIVPDAVKNYTFQRNTYFCPKCKKRLAKCRACQNYACWDSYVIQTPDGHTKEISQYHQFCAEHRHLVANFETLNSTLSNPTEFRRVYKKVKLNLSRHSKKFLITLGFVAVTVPLAYISAPALGGAIGTLMGLHGVAATNAGLAFLGFGSLASGGFGMAGGMVVITVAGSALGGALGANVASAYLDDIKDFNIIEVKPGIEPAVITIDGFLSQKNESVEPWRDSIQKYYPNNAWYHLTWESKRLSDLGSIFSSQIGRTTLYETLKKAAKSASKKAARIVSPAGTAIDILQLSKNPWHVAFVKAERTGVILADILKRCEGKKFILVGHSLGAKVVYCALSTLSFSDCKNIEGVHLLGGAVDNASNNWSAAGNCTTNSIHNYYSSNDWVLGYLYKAGTFFKSNPCGYTPIANVAKIKNHDVSSIVNGHIKFKSNFNNFCCTD